MSHLRVSIIALGMLIAVTGPLLLWPHTGPASAEGMAYSHLRHLAAAAENYSAVVYSEV